MRWARRHPRHYGRSYDGGIKSHDHAQCRGRLVSVALSAATCLSVSEKNLVSIKDGATPALGSLAPDFVLSDVHGSRLSRRDLRGSPALLVFYPFAFTGICYNELSDLRENLPQLEAAGARGVAASCGPVPSRKPWEGDQASRRAVAS